MPSTYAPGLLVLVEADQGTWQRVDVFFDVEQERRSYGVVVGLDVEPGDADETISPPGPVLSISQTDRVVPRD